jgi:hypothetical protein
MSNLASLWLLDKNVVRDALVALVRLDFGLSLNASNLTALELLRAAREGRVCCVISVESANILHHRADSLHVQAVLVALPTYRATRYFRRWARRLRHEGFTREDAKVIALGTFGTDEAETRLGVDAVVTGDGGLIHNYEQRLPLIQRRFRAMTVQLPEPFRRADLPTIMSQVEAVARLR